MGVTWSDERLSEAIEKLEVIAWDSSKQIDKAMIMNLLQECNIVETATVRRMRDHFKEKEYEQSQKARAFRDNNVANMADFHGNISNRCYKISSELLSLNMP